MKKDRMNLNLPFKSVLMNLIVQLYDPKMIRSIYLIGSFARNEMNINSDLDLLIVAKPNSSYKIQQKIINLPEFNQLDLEILKKYSGGLSPIILSVTELKENHSLIINALNEGILLKGEEISEYIKKESIIFEDKKDPKEFLEYLEKIIIDF